MNPDVLAAKALAKWGSESQLDMVIEECGELIVAIQHRRRKRATDLDVLSEGVDVEIMIGQLKFLLRDYDDTWESCRAEKLKRLEQLLEEQRKWTV